MTVRTLSRAVLRGAPGKVMVSHNDCPEVRDLYKDWNIVELGWKYSGTYAVSREAKANGMKEKKVPGKELLVLNYEAPFGV